MNDFFKFLIKLIKGYILFVFLAIFLAYLLIYVFEIF